MKPLRFVVPGLFAAALVCTPRPAAAADVICYNCPPQWADWASMLKAIKTDLGLEIPYDNKNSGQALSQLLSEKNNPIADIGYFGLIFVNKDALGGKPVPACWLDLLKPDYRGMVGYLDPSSAAVGYVGAVAVNLALGGPNNDFGAAIGFFRELGKNDAIVPKQTSYARVVSGEIPILFDYDFNAYRANYTEKGNL